MYLTSSIKAEARFPASSKTVGGLKRTFSIKTLEVLSTKTLQTVKECKEVVEDVACGCVSAAVKPESCSSSLRSTGHHLSCGSSTCCRNVLGAEEAQHLVLLGNALISPAQSAHHLKGCRGLQMGLRAWLQAKEGM